MKTKCSYLFPAWIGFLLFVFSPSIFAYALVLPKAYPDLTTFNVSYNYATTCVGLDKNGNVVSGSSGTCGTTTGSGNSLRNYSGNQISGVFTISAGSTNNQQLNITGSGAIAVTGTKSYTLTANFDGSGNFTGGNLVAKGTTSDPRFQSGTIMTATLKTGTNAFGFSGSGSGGTFYFTCNNVGGDMLAFWPAGSSYCAATSSIVNMVNGPSVTGSWSSGNWDPANNNNPNFWLKRNFTGVSNAGNSVDTYVPVPAAVWLLGSGLLGLVGVARRKTSRN